MTSTYLKALFGFFVFVFYLFMGFQYYELSTPLD
jgi:hypothetical protein